MVWTMRLSTLLAFAALLGVSGAEKGIETGASRSVAELAAAFERLAGNQKENGSAEAKTTDFAPKSVYDIHYPLPAPAAPPNSNEAEIWKLLQSKHPQLRKAKEELEDLIKQLDEAIEKTGGTKRHHGLTNAIIRSIKSNLEYKPLHITVGKIRL